MEESLFERAPVPRAYFKLALPVVCSMVISLVYNMVDTFFVAQTQNTSLVAGVSLCVPIFSLLIALGDIFGLGGSSVISRLFGQKEEQAGRRVSSFCLYGGILCGLVVTTLMLVFQSPILSLLGASGDTLPHAADYYFYLALGAPLIIVSLIPSNLMRTEGMAVESMIGSISGSVVNIILDPVFIFGLDMGAAGAAIATVLGYLVTDVVLLWMVYRKSRKLSLSWREMRITGRQTADIFAIGIPASISNLMQSLSVILINRQLTIYGTDQIAAMGIAMKVNMIVMLIMVGLAFGAQPLIGYSWGAGNWKRLRQIIRFDLMVVVGFSVVSALLLLLFSPQIITIFMEQDSVVSAGSLMLRCLLVTTPFVGITLVFTTLFQAAGKAIPAFLLSISRQGIILALCLWILPLLLGYYGIITAQAAADVLTAVIALLLYLRVGRGTASTQPAETALS